MLDNKNSRFNVNHVSENSNGVVENSNGGVGYNMEPSLQEYTQYSPEIAESYVLSLRHLTHEALPRIDLYRDAQSIHSASRPSLDELHNQASIVKREPGKIIDAGEEEHSAHHKFGWIQGVLILNIMSLWGPMLFLRTSWLVGQGGLLGALGVILFSSTITTITALSTSAIATNGEVKGGGTYYMLSRSLGPEYGGAIGLIFAFANMVGVALNIVGFCESFLYLLKVCGLQIIDGGVNDTRIVGLAALVFCVVICLVGMEWEQKAQNVLLLILLTAIFDVIVGSFLAPNPEQQARGVTGWNYGTLSTNLFSNYRADNTWVKIFSVYFPSATGILSGANISGELKNPQHAIPRGTIWAIGITTFSYVIFALISAGCIVRDASGTATDFTMFMNYTDCNITHPCQWGLENTFLMLEIVAGFRWLIYAGNFAATISSALACFVGAPRVFQALCRDKIYPGIHIFEKGYGKSDDPIRAYGLTFVIAMGFILIGDLNAIAPIMSNFFMAAFCLINFACFHAAMAKSPGFRPGFRFWNMWISLMGAVLCLVVMFVMEWMTAIITIVICFFLYMYIYFQKPNVNWGSSAQAEVYRQALKATLDLNRTEEHVKNYRPQILVLTGKPNSRPPMVDFAYSITKGISLMVCGHVSEFPMDHRARLQQNHNMNSWLQKRQIKAFYSPTDNESLEKGVKALIQLVGVGKLRPNMVMLGFKQNWQDCDPIETVEYVNILHDAFDMYLAVTILRLQKGLDYSVFTEIIEEATMSTPPGRIVPFESQDSGLELASSDSNASLADGYASQTEDNPTPISVSKAKHLKQTEKKKKKKAAKERRKSLANVPKEIIDEMDRFRAGKTKHKGTIDVWWLYDDGGLTLLIPHLLSLRKSWHKCKLRVFSLANRNNQIDEEHRNLVALLHKFRIDCLDVVMLPDVTKSPHPKTVKEFEEITNKFSESSKHDKDMTITEEELISMQDKCNRHMRVHELLQEHSRDATLVVMTLPMPRKGRISAALYMAWLEILTKDLPPCLLVRGNQTSVLTFYS